MQPGRYRIRWNLANRIPDPGSARSAIHESFLRHNAGTTPILRLVERLPPRSVVVPGNAGAAEDAGTPADVLLTRGQSTLLLARDGNSIVRLFPKPEMARRILDNWTRFHPYLNVPRVEEIAAPVAGVHGVREAVVPGTTVWHAEPDAITRGFRDFLQQCARHAEIAEGRFGRDDEVRALFDWPIPAWLSRSLHARAERLINLVAETPALYSHADCHTGNLILLPDGGVGIIDLERAETMPFFFDPLYMLRNYNRVGTLLREQYFSGAFDTELAAIWQAAGREFCPAMRLDYLLAVAMAHALRTQYVGDSIHTRVRKLAKPTRALRPYCESEEAELDIRQSPNR